MATKGLIFFAGVGTTFAILAMGFGGGFLMASSTLHETPALKRASVEPPSAVRVVLPTSEQPPLKVTAAAPAETPASVTAGPAQSQPQIIPVKDEVLARSMETNRQVERAEQQKAERAEQRKAEAAESKRRKQYAERKAKQELARLKQQQELQQRETPQRQPGILAFGMDDERPRSGGFFGN